MDFFEHQDRARKKTGLYLFLFGIAIFLIAVVIYFLLIWGMKMGTSDPAAAAQIAWVNPALFSGTLLGVVVIVLLGSVYKIHLLSSGGGKAVAEMLGGHLIPRHSTQRDERKLLNVVEEMAIASGVPVPEVYLLEDQAINAFAAGNTTSDAVVGVTRGCMEQLSRDELQGVVAHEFSHILNGDMRLNIRLMGLLHGILVIALIGYVFFRFSGSIARSTSRSRDKGAGMGLAGAVFITGLALYVVGYIGVFFANLIKSAVSRQREFLADASAVQFTRNPEGIAGALKKIGQSYGSKISDAHASEASHLFFASSLSGFWAGLFATHPPLPERIRAIEGLRAGMPSEPPKKYTAASAARENQQKADAAKSKPPLSPLPGVVIPGMPGVIPGDNALRDALGVSMLAAGAGHEQRRGALEQIAATAPEPQNHHLQFAAAYLDSLPGSIQTATTDPFAARAVILHLLLTGQNHSPADRDALAAQVADEPLLREFRTLAPDFESIALTSRLTLLDMCVPALKQLSPAQYKEFRSGVLKLISIDGQVDFLEFCLERTLVGHLDIFFQLTPPPRVEFYTLEAVGKDCQVLLSCLAHVGAGNVEGALAAYNDGWKALKISTGGGLLALDQCTIEALGNALDKLQRLSPPLKMQFLSSCSKVVLSNNQINDSEGELIRAYAENLGVPLPPMNVPPVV